MIEILKRRFEENKNRHPSIEWSYVEQRLKDHDEALIVLTSMEDTGGEPDVVGIDETTGEIIFYDCSTESPKGRRSLCYDDEGLKSRKKNPPKGSAVEQANAISVELLTEEQYQRLQSLGSFDLKSSSWIKTPEEISEDKQSTL